MMTQYTFAACGQRNATVKYEHAPMIRARQVAQANTHLEDEELIEKNSAYRNWVYPKIAMNVTWNDHAFNAQ